ncbi:b(o/a)3-type cytochrome-c oxidase subunit 1 [Brevibacillus laterosporus]|uniref:b(o/a)3-type cytochrome-c oxidase subunit 1 n=1 Tax=Brevibacillus laterosporus TaxID=1465 RepID=UPI002406B57D|nr:b(o/a)3-type cytochrome-c oxidase subunit 1 [Brevibacillus laterosporus]MDF9411445.1 b(o/a)3-type cytochrome-c oxidase subunit 1 [Brevibacillus laterosporus]
MVAQLKEYHKTQPVVKVDAAAAKLSLAHIYVAYIGFAIAILCGLLQGLVRGGVITLPSWLGYYQVLTAHGVLLGLVFTTFFIIGFFISGCARTSEGKLTPLALKLGWIGWLLMTVGTAMATVAILSNEASVLYTFYAPMKASPLFYIGSALLVVGSWMGGYSIFTNYIHWRKTNKGKTSPLFQFMAVSTMILWQIATLGVAAEVLLQLIPWSLGWVPEVNVLLSRTLFWYFGHPLVYFWLMPAYVCWYVNIPKIIGGKVFSDSLARLSFILLILFSIPVGFHHQLMEPGISDKWKMLHVILTLTVVFPSLMTAFSLFAVFETSGRKKGAKGLFGWFSKLPWKDARFFAPMLGMLAFIPAGAGGIINASNQMNAVVHNTIWVTGHFHLTVGTSIALTFFGITYWLLPNLTGRKMTPALHRVGILQAVMWSVGMLLMSGAMHYLGLQGVPRRTDYTTYFDNAEALSWIPPQQLMGFGGAILFFAGILMVGILFYLIFKAPKGEEDYPIAESQESVERTPKILERWSLWLGIAVFLIIVAYAYPIYQLIDHAPPGSKPFITW